jgi:hypothetical protein
MNLTDFLMLDPDEMTAANLLRAATHTVRRTKDFALIVDVLHAEPLRGLIGYRLINLRTGVAEGEGVNEDHGIRATHRFQRELDEVLRDPEGASSADAAAALFGGPPSRPLIAS